MNKEQIQKIFSSKYDIKNWKEFLNGTFPNVEFYQSPEILIVDKNVSIEAIKLGSITINENGIQRKIEVFEVKLAKGIVLERNRVGLRNLLKRYWKNIDAAFITYYKEESNKWRFTYVSELSGFNDIGDYIEIKTEPKRYTYVLGEGESVRTAVERFDKKKKRGKQLTLEHIKEAFSVEKLSKSFFDEYKKQYEDIVEFLTGKRIIKIEGKWTEIVKSASNPQLAYIFNGDEKEARDFCKKLMGRIIFLYFVQKKGWLGATNTDYKDGNQSFLNSLYELSGKNENFYSFWLSSLFFDTLNQQRKEDNFNLPDGMIIKIPFLNGGLFEEENPKLRNLILPITIFDNIFNFFNQYNFTIYEDDPNDHTIAVDPEMLSHIFENLLEDNKEKGAYYTPKGIVHYMCQESLIEYLTTWFEANGYSILGLNEFVKPTQTKFFSDNDGIKGQLLLDASDYVEPKVIDRDLIERLLKKKLSESDKDLILKHKDEFNIALDNVKICDPAIGSGAFPMGLLHEIFTTKQTLHTFKYGNTENFKSAKVKLNIIQNSIYGVDIEKGAVDIARLRFWLSLIVDEEKPTALPNLDYKIVVGNSLVSKFGDDIIDIDWELKEENQTNWITQENILNHHQILNQISKKQKEYFSPDSNKQLLALDIRNLKIDLLINQLDLMIKTIGTETETLKGKIDKKHTEKYLLTKGWKNQKNNLVKLKLNPNEKLNYFDWKLDFPEIMNPIINKNIGFDIVIGNPPWVSMKGKHGINENKRNNLEELTNKYDGNSYLPNLFEFFIKQSINLFRSKGLLTFIIPDRLGFNKNYSLLRKELLTKYKIKQVIYKWKFETVIADTMTIILKNECFKEYSFKIKSRPHFEFNEYSKTKILHTELSELRGFENFDINKIVDKIKLKSNELIKFAQSTSGFGGRSKEITEHRMNPSQIEVTKGKCINKYEKPKILYFEFKDTNLTGRTRDKDKLSIIEKILLRKTANEITATYDNSGIYPEQSLYFIYNFKINAKYILGILNSKLLNWYYLNRLVTNEDSTPQLKNYDLDAIPIMKVNETKEYIKSLIISLVDIILSNKEQNLDTNREEMQIDLIVYKLYELTNDEIKVVDPNFGSVLQEFSLSPEDYENMSIEQLA
ncbi:MAG: Eco57I restriction-modification methylase domain-containing protein [Candidatus Kapabacteria bacterium]|nr:Eco57I restriction-modification methylase domain-containing protein [Candidatus Kapabacteria bacterium]